jgi:hypothetical protein
MKTKTDDYATLFHRLLKKIERTVITYKKSQGNEDDRKAYQDKLAKLKEEVWANLDTGEIELLTPFIEINNAAYTNQLRRLCKKLERIIIEHEKTTDNEDYQHKLDKLKEEVRANLNTEEIEMFTLLVEITDDNDDWPRKLHAWARNKRVDEILK